MTIENTVLQFISHYSNHKSLFLNGQCYWFAHILFWRFRMFYPCAIYYNQIDNHFATAISNHLFDASGEIPFTDNWLRWTDYASIEPLDANRVYRDCILQIPEDQLTDLPSGLQTYNAEF